MPSFSLAQPKCSDRRAFNTQTSKCQFAEFKYHTDHTEKPNPSNQNSSLPITPISLI